MEQRIRGEIQQLDANQAHMSLFCDQQIQHMRAMALKMSQELSNMRMQLDVARSQVMVAKDKAAKLTQEISVNVQEAARAEDSLKQRQSDLTVTLTRLRTEHAELTALINLLNEVSAKMTQGGLAEVGSQLTALAKSHEQQRVQLMAMVEVANQHAQSSESAIAADDLRDMIAMLVKQLQSELSFNVKQATSAQDDFNRMRQLMVAQIQVLRAKSKQLTEQRDQEVYRATQGEQQILMLTQSIQTSTTSLTNFQAQILQSQTGCQKATNTALSKKATLLQQLRVLGEIRAKLKNHNVSSSVLNMIKDVKLDLPIWQVGDWSRCSAQCGLGKQTRSVSCVGARCLGDKPQSERVCNLKPCRGDCVLSAWSAWSTCSARCGGGSQQRTRKILSQAVNGGLSCPSPAALQQSQQCNTQTCSASTTLRTTSTNAVRA
jgi:hypothetical protein